MAKTKPQVPTTHTKLDIRAQLRAAGLRVTLPRIAVLHALHQAATPLSHPELVESLTSEGLDRVTIYRNLNDLATSGIVRRRDHGDHVWRFEIRKEEHDGKEHPHFVCNSCGDVQCLPAELVHVELARKAPSSLRKRQFEVQLKGECERCASA